MNKKILGLLLLLWGGTQAIAQNDLVYTLREVVDLATNQSADSKRVETTFDNSFWSYRTFLANYRPQLTLSGTILNFDRSISAFPQPDGSEVFSSRQQNFSTMQLSLDQNIALTGGSIGLVSSLDRIDIFSDGGTTSYLAQPVQLQFNQPLFRANTLRWDRKIEPLRYEESIREYNENMENIAVQVTELFFTLLIAQQSYLIAEKNLANNDTLFQIAKGRYNLGKIAENDLLQMELAVMNARTSHTQASLDIKQANLRLAIFLGLTGTEKINLVPPPPGYKFKVDEQLALEKALANRKESIRFNRQRLEADRDLAQAKGDNGFTSNLNASFGLTNNSELLETAYQNPQDAQRVSLGINVPILDWGRGKGRIRTAMANRDLSLLNIQQEELNFEQEVLLLVNRFDISREQLIIAMKSDTVAQKRYDISKKRYEIGKIDILDLNVALTEKDQAKQSYLQALRSYWSNYYELRRRTLFDFAKSTDIHYR